jgi:hypothetical protein
MCNYKLHDSEGYSALLGSNMRRGKTPALRRHVECVRQPFEVDVKLILKLVDQILSKKNQLSFDKYATNERREGPIFALL